MSRKIVVVSPPRAGAPSLLRRICLDDYVEQSTQTEVDLGYKYGDRYFKDVVNEGRTLRLNFFTKDFERWGGRSIYEVERDKHYEGAAVIILLVDLTSQNAVKQIPILFMEAAHAYLTLSNPSTLSLQEIAKMWSLSTSAPSLFVVGTKSDCQQKRVVCALELEKIAQTLAAHSIETSAKSGFQIEELCLAIKSSALDKFPEGKEPPVSWKSQLLGLCELL